MKTEFFFFEREASGNDPGGVTVSKTKDLPEGTFQIDEFCWPHAALGFVANHEFTEDERQEAYKVLHYIPELLALALTN